jgi:hypothetical protein
MTAAESPARARPRLVRTPRAGGSISLLVLMLGLVLASAGKTLGYDYTCYEGAARHLLDGKPIYDNAFSISVGTCPGTYTYPPAFAVALVPWLLFGGAAAGLWCVAMAACFVAGVALLPVRRDVRWLVVVVAALDWPLLYAVKLGQVEPLLFLGFAAAWRWMDRPGVVGVAAALGALVKVQPGLLAVWALATRRYRAAVVAVVVGLAAAAGGHSLHGARGVGDVRGSAPGLGGTLSPRPTTLPRARSLTWRARRTGGDGGAAGLRGRCAAAALAAWRWASPVASLQVTIVVSQLLSAPLRDHYAVLLLLPVAWLVGRGRKWAALIPLLGWISLFADDTPSTWLATASVPLTFFGVLAVLLERREVGRGHHVVTSSAGTPRAAPRKLGTVTVQGGLER